MTPIEKICEYFTLLDANSNRRHYNEPLIITRNLICGKSRRYYVVAARMFVAVYLRNEGWAYTRIGDWMGGRDHSSILHLIDKYRDSINTKWPNDIQKWANDLKNFLKPNTTTMTDQQQKALVRLYQFFKESESSCKQLQADKISESFNYGASVAYGCAASQLKSYLEIWLDVKLLDLAITPEMEKEAANVH